MPDNLHYLQTKESPIHGVGLFSGVNLASNCILFEIKGERIKHEEYDPRLADKNLNWLGIGYCQWINFHPGDNGLFINHSCNPNVIVNEKLQLITLAPVKSQDELLLDYSTTELDPHWQMACNCGESCCRKVLRSYQFLPRQLQHKYSGYLAPIFTEVADRLQMVMPTTV